MSKYRLPVYVPEVSTSKYRIRVRPDPNSRLPFSVPDLYESNPPGMQAVLGRVRTRIVVDKDRDYLGDHILPADAVAIMRPLTDALNQLTKTLDA